jgi:Sulfotransferase domain
MDASRYYVITKKLRREAVVRSLFFLPEERRRQLERWLRGREECWTLKHTDTAIVSCGKSGRTWLRVMLSHFFHMRYDLPGTALIGFDNFHYRNHDIPRIFFTHDSYIHFYTGNFNSKSDYRKVKTLLFVRHPADVAVSQFFQWKHRIIPRKKWLNEYPLHNSTINIFDFVMDKYAGLPYVVQFLNGWNKERSIRADLEAIRYEDMRRDAKGQLERLIRWLGYEPTPLEIDQCVDFGSFENMKKMEKEGVFWLAGRAMKQKGGDSEENQKVRRGIVGGWRDYFDDGQASVINSYVEENLLSGFGYLSQEPRGSCDLRDGATAQTHHPSATSTSRRGVFFPAEQLQNN